MKCERNTISPMIEYFCELPPFAWLVLADPNNCGV